MALGTAADAVAMSVVLINTNLAAAAGVITALSVSRLFFGRIDLMVGLNGGLAGLVSITAGPDFVTHIWAVLIGIIGAVICTAGIKLLEVVKVDDVVGAVPVHLFAGIWGTIAVCIAAGGNILVQLVGIASVGVFVFGVSWVVWFAVSKTIGLRVTESTERIGQDAAELGMESYPEFVLMPEVDEDD